MDCRKESLVAWQVKRNDTREKTSRSRKGNLMISVSTHRHCKKQDVEGSSWDFNDRSQKVFDKRWFLNKSRICELTYLSLISAVVPESRTDVNGRRKCFSGHSLCAGRAFSQATLLLKAPGLRLMAGTRSRWHLVPHDTIVAIVSILFSAALVHGR